MDLLEPGKLFVARLLKTINETAMKEHFNKYGEVKYCMIIIHRITCNPRGFGFVNFTNPLVAKKALKVEHYILGRKLDVKPALPKGEKPQNQEDEHVEAETYFKTNKIFVGGLPHNLAQEEFKSYFEKFGTIINGVLVYIKESDKSRGFGFITFDSDESVDQVTNKTYHELNDKLVEVKRAWPKHKKENMIHTFDCNKIGFGGSQFDYCSKFWLYGARCFSCLLHYGFGHKKECLYYNQSTAGYITWQPKEVPTNS